MPEETEIIRDKSGFVKAYAYLHLLRPKHWVKNLFILAAPFFGGVLFSKTILFVSLPVFLTFSLSASAVYVINDIFDLEKDRLHPVKKRRPLASGVVSRRSAILFSALLAVPSLSWTYLISSEYAAFVVTYILIQIAYSAYLKKIALVDIFCIASGFIIRVLAGGAAFNIEVSHWLMITMFMISLVLASGKRLGEIRLLKETAQEHRESLNRYSSSTLNEILLISASSSLIAYALYTVEQLPELIYTVPVVTFGLFRYVMLSSQGLGDPTEALTHDRGLLITVVLWLLIVGMIRY